MIFENHLAENMVNREWNSDGLKKLDYNLLLLTYYKLLIFKNMTGTHRHR